MLITKNLFQSVKDYGSTEDVFDYIREWLAGIKTQMNKLKEICSVLKPQAESSAIQ